MHTRRRIGALALTAMLALGGCATDGGEETGSEPSQESMSEMGSEAMSEMGSEPMSEMATEAAS